MKQGKCIKCGHNQVYKVGSSVGSYRIIGISIFFGIAYLTDYICSSCGYVESYIEDQNKLDFIKHKFKKV